QSDGLMSARIVGDGADNSTAARLARATGSRSFATRKRASVLAAIPSTTLRKNQTERACAEEEGEHRRRRLVERGAVAVRRGRARRRVRGSAGLRRDRGRRHGGDRGCSSVW